MPELVLSAHHESMLEPSAQGAPHLQSGVVPYESPRGHFREAIKLRHPFPLAHFNLGTLLLRLARRKGIFGIAATTWPVSRDERRISSLLASGNEGWDSRRLLRKRCVFARYDRATGDDQKSTGC